MKCSWFFRSLRLAVLGGLTIACSLTGGRLGNAAIVSADLPSWMTSLRQVNLYDYRVTCEGDSLDQPSPWLAPDEDFQPYGDAHTSYYEANEYRPYAEESTTADEMPATEESTTDNFTYDYGYRYGYRGDSDAAPMANEGESYAAGEGEYSDEYNGEAMNAETAPAADESEYGYNAPMYGEYGETGRTEMSENETSFNAEDEASPYQYEAYAAPQSETEAARETETSDDYSYRYEYSYARDKYGYWAGSANEDNEATGNAMEASDESDGMASEEATDESDEDDSAAMYEQSQPNGYGDKYDFSTDGTAADSMTEESDETAYDEEGESYEAGDESMSGEGYHSGMSYGEAAGMGSFSDDAADEDEEATDEDDDAATDAEARWESSPQTYICGSLAETYQEASWSSKFAADTSRETDLASWRPEELLTDADRDILRQLAHLYEESQEVRRTVLNDYIETLGWEALKLAERFEDCSNVEFLGFSEDLPSLAALLATFRRLERNELTMDQAVDLLCHNVGSLPEQWIDAVDTIATEEEYDAMSGASYSLPNGDRPTACEALGLWFEQSWDNASVAFRNIAQQIVDMGAGVLSAQVQAEQAAVAPDYPWYYETF